MEGASFVSSRSIGYRPVPNDSVARLANNNTQKSLNPILDQFKGLLKEREEEIRVSSGGDDGIEIPLPRTEEIVEFYKIVLSELTINAKPIINDLTVIAGEQREHAGGIADAICARIVEVPVELKLPSLYLLDSIVKNIGREYLRHFSARLPEVYCLAYRQVQPSMHPYLRRLFDTWSTVFPSPVLRKIEVQLQLYPSSSYQSSGLKISESPQTHGIHVSPNYSDARHHLENSTTNIDVRPPPLPTLDGFAMDDRRRPDNGLGEFETPVAHGVSNGFHIQRPGVFLDTYGADKTFKKTNEKVQNPKKLTINGSGSKVGGLTWQNTEEDEFEWEDMSPTLVVNRSMPTKTDFSRANWSNQDPLPSIGPDNGVSSSDHGLKRKLSAFHNDRYNAHVKWSPPVPFNNHIGSQFNILKPSNSVINEHQKQSAANENRAPNQIQGQIGKFPPQFSPLQDIRPNMVPFNPSYPTIRPMIRGYTPQSSSIQSLMPFHNHGVRFPPLHPAPSQIPQLPLPNAPNPLSGLFNSLMAQGLLSVTKPTPEQVGLEFDLDVLKTRHESAITALYSDLPRQCKTCGLRFKSQEEHSNHMDWHVTKNRVSKNRKQKPSQKWFANVSVWLSSAEALGIDPVPGFLLPSENVVEKKDDDDVAVPADEDQNVCALCGEPFDDFYSDETEEWMYRGAVYMNGQNGSTLGPIVHAKCQSESTVDINR